MVENIVKQQRHLVSAERQLWDGRALVAEQKRRVAEGRARGEDTTEAESLLAVYEDALVAWVDYRNEVATRLASLMGATDSAH